MLAHNILEVISKRRGTSKSKLVNEAIIQTFGSSSKAIKSEIRDHAKKINELQKDLKELEDANKKKWYGERNKEVME